MTCFFGVAQECAIHPSEFISILAFVVSIVTVRQTVRHYKLTSKPHLVLDSWENRGGDGAFYFETTLSNVGFGPAIIKEYKFIQDGNEYVFDHTDELLDLVKKTVRQPIYNYQFKVYRHGAAIGKETNQVVAKFGVAGCSEQELTDIKTRIKNISLEIKYESVYGEKLFYNSNSHRKDFNKIKMN